MKKRFVSALLISAVLIASFYVYTAALTEEGDPNRVSISRSLTSLVPVQPAGGSGLAKVWIPGPGDSYNIQVHIQNLADGPIRFVSLSLIKCKTEAGERLIIDGDGVWGYPVEVYSPDGENEVPVVVMEFTSFDPSETVQFSLDPDTFADPNYGATVSEMVGLKVQVWLEDGVTAGGGIFTSQLPTRVGCLVWWI